MNRRSTELVAWLLLFCAVTALLVTLRDRISDAYVPLAYLLIVLGASARMGRTLGLAIALTAFVAFNFFFIAPYYTFAIHHAWDILVLLSFLAASTVATQLLHRAQSEARRAEQRARQIDRLAAVGAEALKGARALDAVAAVAEVIRSGLNCLACEIYMVDGEPRDVRRVALALRADAAGPEPAANAIDRAMAGLAIGETGDGTTYVAGTVATLSAGELAFAGDTHALLLPLRVRDEAIGVLRMVDRPGFRLDVAQQRFAEALSYYAVLALERVRFASTAEREEALREADRLKDTLLASVSHDLRTPLTTIRALAHDIAATGDDRAVVIVEESDRLNRFVSDLLDLSRLNAGAQEMKPELIAADDVLGAALQRISGSSHRINAQLQPDEPLLIGRFDFVHTLRALVNVIENAVKYSPADASVDVNARRDGDQLVFEIADRGAGIPASEQSRMFEPFIRGTIASDRSGVGLGLAIARQSIELQNGSLTYAPRTGGGSVFTIRLPLASPAELTRMQL